MGVLQLGDIFTVEGFFEPGTTKLKQFRNTEEVTGGAIMYGLSGVNIELTSRCQKSCWMCGRRKLEREHPEKCDWGDMPFDMVQNLSEEIPKGVFVQFHWNGEPLMYPKLLDALTLFRNHHTGLDTNGKLLFEKAYELIGYIDTLTISVIQDDPEAVEQFDIVSKFLDLRGDRKPMVIFRILGDVLTSAWEVLAKHHNCQIVTRTLHSPDMSKDYEKPVTIPETGVCQEMLHKLAIDRFGNVSPCVRYDPDGVNRLGRVDLCYLGENPDCWGDPNIKEVWYGDKRKEWVKAHMEGRREDVPLCGGCSYWGVPCG